MITLTKSGNTIVFEFDDNSGYLQNGTIEVPLNSLSLITDESEMATFRKSASNDIFVSARYDDFGMTKAELEQFYKDNMVGSTGGGGVTPEEVEEMIDEAVSGKADTSAVTEAISSATEDYFDGAEYDSGTTRINFYHGNTVKAYIDASAFIVDGMIDNVSIETISGVSYLVIDFNTASGKEDIQIPLTDIFDPSNYYNKTEIDAALSGKQDTLIAGENITISGNVISSSGGGATYTAGDGINIDSANTISTTFEGYFPVQDFFPTYNVTDNLYVLHYTGEDDIWCDLFILNEEGIPFQECSVSINGSVTAHTFEVTTFVEDFPWEDYITIDWYDSDILKVSKSADSPYGDGEVYIFKAEGIIANGFEAGTVTDTIKSMAKVMSTLPNIDYVVEMDNNLYNDLNDAKVNKSSVVSSVTSASTDSQIPTAKAVYASISAATSGKVDTSTFNTYTGNVENAISGKQDILTAGDGIYIDGDTIKTRYRGWSSDFTRELTCPAGDMFELVAGFDCEGSTEGDATFSFDEGGETVTFHFHFNSANGESEALETGWGQYFNIEYYDGIFVIDPNDNIVVTATDDGCTRFTQSGFIGAGSTTDALDEAFSWLESKVDKYDAVHSAEYVSSSTTINFKNIYGEIISYIDASDFIVDGMVEDVRIATIRGVSYLVIDFNTASGKQDIQIPLTDIFDPSNYYNKTEIDAALSGKADTTAVTEAISEATSGKVDTTTYTAYTSATDARLAEDEEVTAAALNDLNEAVSGKQDTLIAGDNITISGNVISADGGGKAVSGGTNISITTGETADTINCTLPITANTSGRINDIAIGNDIIGVGGDRRILIGNGNKTKYQNSRTGESILIGTSSSNSSLYNVVNAANCIGIGGDGIEVGYDNISGYGSIAIGYRSKSIINKSLAIGYNTVASGSTQTNINNQLKIDTSNQVYIYNKDNTEMICLQDQLGGGSITIDQTLDSGSTNPVANSAITTAFDNVDSRLSEDEEVTAAALNNLNDKFGGLQLVKLTQQEYDALVTKDSSTLYIITE